MPPDQKKIAKVLKLVDERIYPELDSLRKRFDRPVASWDVRSRARCAVRLGRIRCLSEALELWADEDPAMGQVAAALESFVRDWEKNPSRAALQLCEDLENEDLTKQIWGRYGTWLRGIRPMQDHRHRLAVRVKEIPGCLICELWKLRDADAARRACILEQVEAQVVPAVESWIGTGDPWLRELGEACLSYAGAASQDPAGADQTTLLRLRSAVVCELGLVPVRLRGAYGGAQTAYLGGEAAAAV